MISRIKNGWIVKSGISSEDEQFFDNLEKMIDFVKKYLRGMKK